MKSSSRVETDSIARNVSQAAGRLHLFYFMTQLSKPPAKPSTHWGRLAIYLVAIAACVVVLLLLGTADWEALRTWLRNLNPFLLFALMVLVPLLGGPVSVFYLAAGVRFGSAEGLLWALVAVALHLICSWWIAKSWLQRPLDRLLNRFNFQKPIVPEGEYVPVCLLVSLVPGILYAAKNYLMVLAEVPFRPYFYTCLPAHFFHAAVGILLGGLLDEMSWLKAVFFMSYALLILGLSHYVLYRLKKAGTRLQAER